MGQVLLSPPEIAKLYAAHRHAKTWREGDRIKAVVWMGKGWIQAAVAEVLLLNEGIGQGY